MGGTDHAPSLADLGEMAADGHDGIIVGWTVGAVCLILTFIILVVTVAKMLTVESNKIRNYCIAILFTPFVYCLCSYLALYFMKADVVFEYIKKIYEAVALYLYLLILVRYCGGYTALRDQINEEVGKKKYFAVFPCCCLWCCLPKHKYSKWLLWFNKYGVLQLTIVRCIFMFLSLFLAVNGWYEEGNIEFDQGYFYTKFVDAASLILCLWALFILYKAVHHILHQGRATTKFVAIKLIIILIFIQQCVFSILVKADAIPTDNDTWPAEARAQAWANFLICLECPIFGIIFWFAFTLKDAKYGIIEKEERKQRRVARRNEKVARKQEKREEKDRKKEEKKQKKEEKKKQQHKDVEMQPVSQQSLAQHEDEHSTESDEGSSSASEEV